MRAEGLRSAVTILIAGGGVGLAAVSAYAETVAPAALEAPDNAEAGIGDAMPTASEAERREQRELRYQRREQWWTDARAVLFSDIQLSAEQSRGVDEIIETQLADGRRAAELQAEFNATPEDDEERRAAIRKANRALQARRKDVHACIEELRTLISEEQRPSFDMNRARLFAKGQKPRKQRRKRRPGADAVPTPVE